MEFLLLTDRCCLPAAVVCHRMQLLSRIFCPYHISLLIDCRWLPHCLEMQWPSMFVWPCQAGAAGAQAESASGQPPREREAAGTTAEAAGGAAAQSVAQPAGEPPPHTTIEIQVRATRDMQLGARSDLCVQLASGTCSNQWSCKAARGICAQGCLRLVLMPAQLFDNLFTGCHRQRNRSSRQSRRQAPRQKAAQQRTSWTLRLQQARPCGYALFSGSAPDRTNLACLFP